MSDSRSKIGILIIVFILAVVGILIVVKTRQEAQSAAMIAASIPPSETLVSEADNVASSSNLSSPIPKPASLDTYAYPNAKQIESSSSGIVLESDDSVQLISDWYKNKINSLDFNAKSFTQTNTNGEVLNKFSAAKPGENLEVTIKKDQTTSNVEITVDRS